MHANATACASTAPPEGWTTPAGFYTDPVRFRDEFEHWFCRSWIAVGRGDEIPDRGDYLVRALGDESVIVVRDAEGEIRAFHNVCRHRGTRLCEADRGRFAGTIQCPYHAWNYDLSGRLVGAPHMEHVAGFLKEELPLAGVAVGVWEGHLFLNLGPEPTPLDAHLAGLTAKFRAWGMADLRLGARVVYDVAANWKLIVQNYSECLHCPVIHPALQKLSHYLGGVNEPASPGSVCLGGWMTLRDGVASMTLDGTTRRDALPGLDAEQRRRVAYYAVLPNLLLSLHPDYVMTHVLWPRGLDRTEVVCEWHFHPEALRHPDFNPGDAVGFWDLTNRQDWHVCTLAQLGVKSRGYRPGPYSGREVLLAALDRALAGAMPSGGEPAPREDSPPRP